VKSEVTQCLHSRADATLLRISQRLSYEINLGFGATVWVDGKDVDAEVADTVEEAV